MDFDTLIDRRGTRSSKWDLMEKLWGVSADDGIAMSTADMDFHAAEVLQDAIREQLDIANYGYFCDLDSYRAAVAWWMRTRHDWHVEPEWMLTTAGLGNGIAMCLLALTEPGDHIITFNPVYHEFERKIRASGRVPHQRRLEIVDGVYAMDLEALEADLTDRDRAILISSPHNPAGRIWTEAELRALAELCERHDMLLISDEIHHDLILPGHRFVPAHRAAPEFAHRMVLMTSASKTFNIAGTRLGNVMIPDPDLRKTFARFVRSLDLSPNLFGVHLSRAAYSPAGAAWVDALVEYLDGNQRLFNAAMNAIPGLAAMPMQATYLAWVDFAGTGMEMSEVRQRVYGQARIAGQWGPELGPGGETWVRFNVGTQRARVSEAADRLAEAFSDLQ